jgi:hypothetical protein
MTPTINKENTVQMTVTWEGERAPFAKAFVAAQMATEAVKKAATNPAFKSKYADLSEVVEAVVPALNKAGIGVMQFPSYDGELVGVTTVLMHESGATVTGTLHLRPSKSDPQGVGSAVTYARRYSLLAMTGAAPEDDDGAAASGPRQAPPATAKPASQPTLTERANRLAATLEAAKTQDDLRRTFDRAAGLCADLDAADPERLVELTALYERLFLALDGIPAGAVAA